MRPLGVELAAMLADRGVDTIFGIPGVHNIELYRGIEEAGIRHVLARHEQGAGFMADGYARATGKPGVAFVISGPGLTNIMTPMGQAYSDSVPMLVISTVLDDTASKRGQLHQMRDQEGATATVCDWSETARTAFAAYSLVDKALIEFATKRPRACNISIPIRVVGGPAEPFPTAANAMATRPYADPKAIGEVARLLANARRPLFIFGGGLAQDASSAATIAQLLKLTSAASFTTYAGRGLVAADASLHFGAHLSQPGCVDVLASADLVIVVGTELAEVDTLRDALGDEGIRIRVDLDPSVLAGDPRANHRINADGAAVLKSLTAELATSRISQTTDWSPSEIAAQRAKWSNAVDSYYPGIRPICDALRETLPDNTMIFSDMTQFAYTAKDVWDMPKPGHWHHPNGFGTLGYALPAAIGGALGHDGPTLAIAGDYGFQYTLQELGTAAELGLSLPILIWDNEALGEIRDNMVAAQIAPNAVHAVNPDWEKLAEAYGCAYAAPKTIEALCDATTAAFAAGRPTLILATPEISSSS